MKDFKCNKCGFTGYESELVKLVKVKKNRDSDWEYFEESEYWDKSRKVNYLYHEYTEVCPECKTDGDLEFPTKIELAIDGEEKVYRIFERRGRGLNNNYRYTLDKDALTKDNPDIFYLTDLLSYHTYMTDEGNLQLAISSGGITLMRNRLEELNKELREARQRSNNK